ncbi:AraC family transcriptional regulator [Aphanothece hegewaldii CCALA 016]|uniref:AraC family transcriptional regulator n=1 Tax=Aphanothece hegewaldii CCALA 016 TaxID=2107694 RepID=A0A2T1LU71_9CHRO|nr:helix-turn-helix domain-containing protein [Aphanothece hegewaldii]PSF35006.1 AraC family transcriptional regulator [Aphanothece hegewaldii CCALA 016]
MEIELPPLIKSLSFHDIDEPADRMKRFNWSMEHRQLEGGAFEGELIVAQFSGMQFARMTYNRGIRSGGNSPDGMIGIAVPLSVPQSLYWHGYSLSMNEALLQKRSQGVDFLRRGTFSLGLVTIDVDSLLQVAELTERTKVESLVTGKTHLVQPDPIALKRFSLHLQNLFTMIQLQPQQVLKPETQILIRQAFILLMLDLLDSNQNRLALRPSSRYQLIKQAEGILMENLKCPITVYDLCTKLHVSERTLWYGFQECFGMPPMAYLKTQRLNKIRQQLKASTASQTTVTDVATQWGFWHMGQFAKDYKKMFGESPSETLRN